MLYGVFFVALNCFPIVYTKLALTVRFCKSLSTSPPTSFLGVGGLIHGTSGFPQYKGSSQLLYNKPVSVFSSISDKKMLVLVLDGIYGGVLIADVYDNKIDIISKSGAYIVTTKGQSGKTCVYCENNTIYVNPYASAIPSMRAWLF